MSIYNILGLFALLSFGACDLDKEEVSDGACQKVPEDQSGAAFFTQSTGDWYLVFGSEYLFRYNAEVLYERKAKGPEELVFKDPFKVTSTNPLEVTFQMKEKLLHASCKHNSMANEYDCTIKKTNIPPGQTYSKANENKYNWKVLGHPKAQIFKVDKENQYILANLCSSVFKRRYWLTFSKATELSQAVIDKIKSEVGQFYKDESHYHIQKF